MKKLLALIIISIFAGYLFSGEYNKSIVNYEIERFLSSEIEAKDISHGEHYIELGERISGIDNDLTIVLTYNSSESMFLDHELKKNIEIYEKINFLHAVHNEEWKDDARLFFNLREFSLEKSSMSKILKIYHEDKKLSKLKLNNYLTEIKIPHVPFWSTYSSLNTSEVFKPITEIEKESKTEGFPIIIVKGRYIIKPWFYENYKNIPKVINYILENK